MCGQKEGRRAWKLPESQPSVWPESTELSKRLKGVGKTSKALRHYTIIKDFVWGEVQSVKCLPACTKSCLQSPVSHKLGGVSPTCNSSTLEVEAEGSRVQGSI